MTATARTLLLVLILSTVTFAMHELPLVYANDLVDKVVEGLTEAEPGSDRFNEAARDAEKLTEAQAAEVAQRIVNKVTGDAATSIKTLLNLYKLALKAAPKNPILKKLGEELAKAINAAMGNLIKALRDPRTNGGKLQLNKALEDLGITDENKRFDIIEALEKKVREEEKKERKKTESAKSKSEGSMWFSADTSTLTFRDDAITEIFNYKDGTSDFGDRIVGAEVVIPDFLFTGITPEGEPGFANATNDPIVVRRGTDVFFEMFVPYLIWNEHQLVGFGTDIVLSGVPAGSAYYGGLPELGSRYADRLNSLLSPLNYRFFFEFSVTPDLDLVSLTNNFTVSGAIGFSNSFELNQAIPEPGTLLLSVGPGLYLLRSRRKRRQSACL